MADSRVLSQMELNGILADYSTIIPKKLMTIMEAEQDYVEVYGSLAYNRFPNGTNDGLDLLILQIITAKTEIAFGFTVHLV